MTFELPALDPSTVTPRTTSGYPEVFRHRVTPREKRALGDALGLTRFGVNLSTLHPGKESSWRHYHAREDEFGDTVGYSEVDLACSKNAEGAWVFTRRDGSTY